METFQERTQMESQRRLGVQNAKGMSRRNNGSR
jgi:hypothetical protein